MRFQKQNIFVLLSLTLFIPAFTSAEEPTAGEKLFALQVKPILEAKCAGCHAEDPDDLQGGFDLRTREAMLHGGEVFGEEVVQPGDATASELMPLIRRELEGMEMPPKQADKLTEEQVWAIRDWINEGAPWPNEDRVAEIYAAHAEGITMPTSGGLSESWTNRKYKPEDLWAFQPIRTAFPTLKSAAENPIDQFIAAGLAEKGLESAPIADRLTLIRRATFDLTGLPPTPAEIEQFLNDNRDDAAAFAALVDRLLESPHYGEQWGRHWLDVVRYADSSGFANDYERPNTWRYRDYVIRAFNNDKPYDQFLKEQLAGDELIVQAEANGKPLSKEQETESLIAAGFLRMGPWEHTGMSVAKVTRQLFLDDITDTVGQVFLAQPLQCCRCHDHKFDPIPTRDFYSMQSIFATTQFAEVETVWLPEENLAGMNEDKAYHKKKTIANAEMLKEVNRQKAAAEAAWFKEQGLPYKTRFEAKKAGAKDDELPPPTIITPEQYGLERIGRKWENRFSWEMDRYQPIAYTVYNGKTRVPKSNYNRITKPNNPLKDGTLEQTAILGGGDPFSPTVPVKPDVLSAVPNGLKFEVPDEISGRRTALANWLVSPGNSLTSRVIVNRIWTFHFGRGIAGNPNNFGATGKKPTHPELLDWLATEFVSNNWSIKQLHRRIMNSEAYRRASSHPNPQQVAEYDPENQSYAVFLPRRLEAEEIRDAMLAASGELNLEMGGIPIRPDMNLEAALQPRMIMGTFAPSYVPNPKPEQRNRRSIYIHNLRGHRLPFMETFNQPGSEVSCELRDQSNITPQVFALMNGQESHDRSLALAIRLKQENSSDTEIIKQLYQFTFGREPAADEIQAALNHWEQMKTVHQKTEITPVDFPTEVVREAVDENSGEPFSFTEKLFAYEDYIPDPHPQTIDISTRALADICLAVLNANEFIYVY
ncbi:DUF1549 domain-containing protein [Rubinisphaera italica]|uniref:Planctomycete cytochrome C n=1 Tax=Rubinisphaera italica TaxID=2527969 RepID=A0A5C5XL35_9PLAN|nr:DUF1549 domain-containing protein [Rubinisphaera italica]TWT63418.1 Planctomycete cytochrome C [Rubinisphaera italica]